MSNSLNLIVAMTKDRVIGINNSIPWHISDDLKNFRKITIGEGGNVIIMGRRTYESIGKPLSKRVNIVVSNLLTESSKKYSEIIIQPTLEDAITTARKYNKDIFLIGGERIFLEGLAMVDKMYITQIKKDYLGNTYFPEFDKTVWNIKKIQEHLEFELFLYERKVNL